jgi:hypothetical protein
MFDPVGSYGAPGNANDLSRDFSSPTNIAVVQINAKNENRNLFDLQSLKMSNGEMSSPYWTEITLPGVHSDIGGGYPDGYQEKDQNMAFYSMQTMINAAEGYGIKFNDIPTNQQPSKEFNQLMDYYVKAQNNLQINPTAENKAKFNSIEGMIIGSSVHNSSWNIKEPLKIYNYAIGSERGVFYPNDKYLNINN